MFCFATASTIPVLAGDALPFLPCPTSQDYSALAAADPAVGLGGDSEVPGGNTRAGSAPLWIAAPVPVPMAQTALSHRIRVPWEMFCLFQSPP